MAIAKSEIGGRDIFIDYDYEEALFRYDQKTNRFFCRLYRNVDETEVRHDNTILNDALRFGTEVSRETYYGHGRAP